MPALSRLAFAAGAAVALTLQGCGGSSAPTPSPVPAPSPSPTPAPSPSPTPGPSPGPGPDASTTTTLAAETTTTTTTVKGPAACLCVFDVDRTLTGKQGQAGQCAGNEEISGVQDTAYTGGTLVLSQVGKSLEGTFCQSKGCFLGIVSAGSASGPKSKERDTLVQRLSANGGKVASTEWSGPSGEGGAPASCEGAQITSSLVLGCVDGTKQFAVTSIVGWLESRQHVSIAPADVHMFDDRENNISPFKGTGYNALQISCTSRAGEIGLCGAVPGEIVDSKKGVHLCGADEASVVV